MRETCMRFGLSVDEALVAFDELTERGILTTQEDSVVVDGKEKIELTKKPLQGMAGIFLSRVYSSLHSNST